MFVRHPVSDYAKWRRAYDDFDGTRTKMGASGHDVYRSVDDPNDVTVWHDFATIDAARAFADSGELKTAMQNAGVAGPPTIWFAETA
jgi:hypothetical protein